MKIECSRQISAAQTDGHCDSLSSCWSHESPSAVLCPPFERPSFFWRMAASGAGRPGRDRGEGRASSGQRGAPASGPQCLTSADLEDCWRSSCQLCCCCCYSLSSFCPHLGLQKVLKELLKFGFVHLIGFMYLLVSFGRPGPMAIVASGLIRPEVFSSILSPDPST